MYFLPLMQTEPPRSPVRIKETPTPTCSRSATSWPLLITWLSLSKTAYFLLSSSSAAFNSYSLWAFNSRTPADLVPLFSLLLSDLVRLPPWNSVPARLVCPGVTDAETFALSFAPFFVLGYKEVISPFRILKPASREKPGVIPSLGKLDSRILIGTFLIWISFP